MNGFFWQSGHLGWGVFACLVFSGLWWLLADALWRTRQARGAHLFGKLLLGWVLGVVVVAGVCLAW